MIDQKLKTFMVLLEEKNYSKTAERLYITQPSVTYHIQNIEKEYGIKLFENSKTFELTDDGKVMLEYAKNSMIENEELVNNFKKKKDREVLEIAFTNMLSGMKNQKYILGNLLDNNLFFNCYSYHHDIILDKIKKGEFDFGIIDHNFYDDKIEGITLFQNKIVLVAKANGKFQNKDRITRENLQQEILVMGCEDSGLYDATMQAFKNKNIKLKNTLILKGGSPDLIANLVENYDAIGFVYENTVIDKINNGTLKILELLNYEPYQNVYLIYSRTSVIYKKKQMFIDKFKKNNEG